MPWFGGNEKAYRDRRQVEAVLWPGAQVLLALLNSLPPGQALIVGPQSGHKPASVRLSGGIAVIPAAEATPIPPSALLVVLPERRAERAASWLEQSVVPLTPTLPPGQALIIPPQQRQRQVPSWLGQGTTPISEVPQAQPLSRALIAAPSPQRHQPGTVLFGGLTGLPQNLPPAQALIVPAQRRRSPLTVRLSGGIAVIPAAAVLLPSRGQALIATPARERRPLYTILCGGLVTLSDNPPHGQALIVPGQPRRYRSTVRLSGGIAVIPAAATVVLPPPGQALIVPGQPSLQESSSPLLRWFTPSAIVPTPPGRPLIVLPQRQRSMPWSFVGSFTAPPVAQVIPSGQPLIVPGQPHPQTPSVLLRWFTPSAIVVPGASIIVLPQQRQRQTSSPLLRWFTPTPGAPQVPPQGQALIVSTPRRREQPASWLRSIQPFVPVSPVPPGHALIVPSQRQRPTLPAVLRWPVPFDVGPFDIAPFLPMLIRPLVVARLSPAVRHGSWVYPGISHIAPFPVPVEPPGEPPSVVIDVAMSMMGELTIVAFMEPGLEDALDMQPQITIVPLLMNRDIEEKHDLG